MSVTLSIEDTWVSEADGIALLTVRLSQPASQAVSVNWRTRWHNSTEGYQPARDSFAFTSDRDYTYVTGTLNFSPGETVKTFAVPLVNDATPERTEAFVVELRSATNAMLGRSKATVTIFDDDKVALLPVISVSDVIVDEASGVANVVVRLDRASAGPIQVGFATQDGTALAGSDFIAQAGTLTFAAGEMAKKIAITLTNDTLAEPTEVFRLALSGAQGGVLGQAQARVVIADNDAPAQATPTISIGDATAGEGDGVASLVVRLSAPSAAPVSVSWQTRWWNSVEGTQPSRDGYAFSTGIDYSYVDGVLTFAPGETVKTISVPLFDDAVAEHAESFQVKLKTPSNGVLGRSIGTVTILDDDTAAALPVISVADVVVDEQAGWADLVVRLDAASAGVVRVNYATVDGTAGAGSDYAAVSGVLAFAPGEMAKTIRIPVLDDALAESAEVFRLALSGAQGGVLGQAQARVMIADNDAPAQATPTISIGDATAGEGDGVASLVVRLSAPSAAPVSVSWQTRWWNSVEGTQPSRDGYAFSTGIDYSYVDGVLTFAPGETVKTISVPLFDDAVAEPAESFQVKLKTPSNGVLGRSIGTVTILDDDTAAALPVISVADVVVDEQAGWADLVVRLDAASAGVVRVNYATVDGTAGAGSDYAAVSGVLAFAPGEMAKTIRIPVLDDALAESAEVFRLALSGAQGGVLGQAQARVMIADNDAPAQARPTISIGDATAGEGDGVASLVVRLSAPSAQQVGVTWETRWWNSVEGTQPAHDGYAFSTGIDYAYGTGRLTFAPGETVKTISVPLFDDAVAEHAESFQVKLKTPSNGVLGRSIGTVTILDDDTAAALPVISVADVVVDEQAGWADLVVRLDAASAGVVRVNYATVDGTAQAGSDYAAVSGVLAFAPGEVTKTVRVAVTNDSTNEPDEFFRLTLANVQGATLGKGQARVTIAGNDAPAQVLPTISIDDVWVSERADVAVLAARLSGPSAQSVSVAWQTSWATSARFGIGQTARDGYSYSSDLDFAYAEGLLAFAPGETLKTLAVPLFDDSLAEAAETFRVHLKTPVNGVLSRAFATVTIADDDGGGSGPPIPPPTAAGGFLDRQVRLEIFSPSLGAGNDLILPQVAAVSDTAIEFANVASYAPVQPGNVVPARIDIAASSIRYEIIDPAPNRFSVTSGFNGYRFSDADGLLPPITGVTIAGGTNTLGLTADRVTFGENEILVNVQGLPFRQGDGFTLQVSFVDPAPALSALPQVLLGTPFPAGYRIKPTQLPGGTRSHRDDLYHGWDFVVEDGATLGAPVLAVAPGRVVFVYAGATNSNLSHLTARREDDGSLGRPGSLGNVITIEHQIGGRTFYSSYFHLMQDPTIQGLAARWAGAQTGGPDVFVAGGETIGSVGNTGAREGTHLHLNLGSQLGSFQYHDQGGVLHTYPSYQIAKGPPDDPILQFIRFADGTTPEGLFRRGQSFAVGDTLITGDRGGANLPPTISGDTTLWLPPSINFVLASSLDVIDPNGQADLAIVRFWDSTPGTDGGYLALDGLRIPNRFIDVGATELGRISYVTGSRPGANSILVEAFDRKGARSNEFTIDLQIGDNAAGMQPPVITPSSVPIVALGSSKPIGALVRISDPNGAANLAEVRIIDPAGSAGGFVFQGASLGADSGWLPFSQLPAIQYAATRLGDDIVTIMVRDRDGNVAQRNLVIQVRPDATSDPSERLVLKEVTPNDPGLLSLTGWQRLAELGTTALTTYLDVLHAFGANALKGKILPEHIATRILYRPLDGTVGQIKALSESLDILAVVETFGNYLNGAIAVAQGADPASELYQASRDSIIALGSGKAGAIAVSAAVGVAAVASVPVAVKVIFVVGAYVVVVGATRYALETVLPEQVSPVDSWTEELSDGIKELFQAINPFDNGTGGGSGSPGAPGSTLGTAPYWSLDLGTGALQSFKERDPEAWALATKRFGIGGAVLDGGLALTGDRKGSPARDILVGSSGADNLDAKAGQDVLFGLGGNDILNGGPGNDLLDGGDGSDTAIYADAPGRVVVDLAIAGPQNTLGGGRDTLVSIENVTGTVFNDTLRGDAGDNRLDGGEGNDIIEGRDGNDILVGGAGTDTAEYRSAGAGVRVSLLNQGVQQDTLGAGLDTLDGIENLTGSPFADVLIGDAGNNILVGLAGDDILEGGEGNDRLDGGEGIDLASYEGAAGPVKVYLNSASATGAAGIDYFVSIEGFVGSAFDDTLVGNAGANVLRGGAGNDRLYGLDGDDVLRGGPGDDILYGGPGNDTADYSDAIVTVRAVLGVNATVNTTNFGRDRYFDIENLAGGAARDFLTGDANANVLTGNGGNDIIAGAGGDDTLLGGEGNDDLTGGPGADLIDLGPAAGNDIVRYTSGADSRFAAMDRIVGFTASGPGFDRIGFENAAGALFAGVAPTAIALGAKVTLASAATIADFAAQLGALAASGPSTLALCQIDVAAGALAGSYLAVNDMLAGFNAATDMLIGIQFVGSATLGAGNFFLF